MTSRTAEGKHTPRFIILANVGSESESEWMRSLNLGLSGFFATRELAQTALDTPGFKSLGVKYKIRQK